MTTATEIALRPARASDVATIAAIYAHHVQHGLGSFDTEAPDVAETERRFAAIQSGAYPYWVAVKGERVLGYAYAAAFRTRPAYRFAVEDSIYLAPQATGRGLGRRLLDTLIEDCTARGFRQMLAVIGDSANASSINLHRACGFTGLTVFEGLGWKFERWVDTVVMQRTLGAGTSLPPDERRA